MGVGGGGQTSEDENVLRIKCGCLICAPISGNSFDYLLARWLAARPVRRACGRSRGTGEERFFG